MRDIKKNSDYAIVKQLTATDSSALFHTKVFKVTKKPKPEEDVSKLPQKYKNIWFLKTADGIRDALCEVIAQELFRLIIPNQPKTRLVKNRVKNIKCVASKEVPGFSCLEEMNYAYVHEQIKQGIFYGLGELMVVALFVNETDFKAGNMGINSDNQIIKIDGDFCFSRLLQHRKIDNSDIKEDEIDNLPLVKSYYSHHWLDWLTSKGQAENPVILNDSLRTMPSFRAEVNLALLKILILPEELLWNFLARYCPNRMSTQKYFNELIDRQTQLRASALHSESFCRYMQTTTAKEDLERYCLYLTNFKTTAKNDLDLPQHKPSILTEFQNLQHLAKCNFPSAQEVAKKSPGMFSRFKTLLGLSENSVEEFSYSP